MRSSVAAFLALLFCLIPLSCFLFPPIDKTPTEMDLSTNWTFRQADSSEWLSAKVPGGVHMDLLYNEKIEDPFYADNEIDQRWIEEKNWIYQTSFQVDKALLKRQFVDLVFEGLDTYAEVRLNGESILTADNMFRSWTTEVKALLQEGENTLEVYFESPINRNREIAESYPYALPSGNEPDDISLKVGSFTRKAGYQFGWDWGPRFVGCGIWRPVYLSAWDGAQIDHVYTQTLEISEDSAQMMTQVQVAVKEVGQYKIVVDEQVYERELEAGTHTISHPFTVQDPQLWWSSGLGDPHLYETNVALQGGRKILDQRQASYGIRTIELINESDDMGTSFYFKLNGRPVFMKGANYIPQDMFLSRVSPEQYDSLIQTVKEANMNMIRVWGGGIYEENLFYDLCDQNGILVWQDFMFACSLYPDLPAFHATIREEVRENIIRLRNHPSIAVWCGNNEVEVAWNNWGWQDRFGYTQEDSLEIWDNYVRIFQQMIPEELESLDQSRPYTSTSPLSNWGTPENFNHSTMHYWGVWHGRDRFEEFANNVGRFMVEYGFQSFPDYSVLEAVIPAEEMRLESDIMKIRQKSYIGNGLILEHVEQYFDTPQSFEEFVARSQETQALGMQMAISSHMEAYPHCMGTLFWQLNDCWPGPSWSVIDYYGNRKAAYEAVKREYGKDIEEASF
ncbi:MAG: sugar-binding domain-containing protein [Bacteroidota bacterium]